MQNARTAATLALLTLLPLTACEQPGAYPLSQQVPIGARTPVDAVVSAASGRDCSVVRIDRGENYCRDFEAKPEPPPFCTRTRGSVDCWTQPPYATPQHRNVADGRSTLNEAQERDRTRRWPGLF